MVNILHLCEMMTLRWYMEEEIHVPIEFLRKFAEKNHFEVRQKTIRKRRKYKLFRKEIPNYFISGDEENKFNFLDIADIHIGNSEFDEELLRSVLQQAVDTYVKYVFIAGDIFEGIKNEVGNLKIYAEQVELAYKIFKDYPSLTYFAINGNHDYTFEQIGMCNPIKILSNKLKEIGIEFNFFDVYLMDFIICGVVKRVMHVERQDFTKKRIFAMEKIKRFEKEFGLNVECGDKIYPVRFFQVGHIHINIQMYFARRKVFISQSGSFLRKDGNEEHANFIIGQVIDKKVFMF